MFFIESPFSIDESSVAPYNRGLSSSIETYGSRFVEAFSAGDLIRTVHVHLHLVKGRLYKSGASIPGLKVLAREAEDIEAGWFRRCPKAPVVWIAVVEKWEPKECGSSQVPGRWYEEERWHCYGVEPL